MTNDCLIPGTEYIADREALNYCEEFKLLGKPPAKKEDPSNVSKRLFKDPDDEPPLKKSFDSLFGP